MLDRQKFFADIKAKGLFKSLSQLQVDTINALCDEFEAQSVNDKRQQAYIFATAYWEAHNPRKPELRMTPMPEFGGEKYLKSKKYYPYYGRGLSQLTWDYNYKKEGLRLNLPLLTQPELILHIPTAANSHVYCMVHGSYTGKKLSDYINADKCDYVNARRIINGKDKAAEIAAIAQKFETTL